MIADRKNSGGTRETGAHHTGMDNATAHDTATRDVGATHASPLPDWIDRLMLET